MPTKWQSKVAVIEAPTDIVIKCNRTTESPEFRKKAEKTGQDENAKERPSDALHSVFLIYNWINLTVCFCSLRPMNQGGVSFFA